MIFAKANYQNNLLMLCKNLRSAAKNSHTGLFFRPRGVAIVKSPFIYKQKGKGDEHKGSYPFPWRRNGDFFLIFAKANYQNNLLMLCKNLRSAAKNSHTGLFFRPRGVAIVKSPFIYKQKGKGDEHKGSYPFPWRRNGDFFLIFAKANYQNNLLMLCKNLRSAAKNSHTGLFFRPRGVAIVKSPFIYKQKGKGHEHKGSYPFPWRSISNVNRIYWFSCAY